MRGHYAAGDRQTQIRLKVALEILAIFLGLKADQVVSQHRLDQFAVVRHAADDGARRPRRMQEEAERLGKAEVAHFRAERQEMIILNPERGVLAAESHQGSRHEGVDLAIGLIVALGHPDQIGPGVQHRPQRRIGKTLVIPAVMRGRQIDHGKRAFAERFDLGKRSLMGCVAYPAAGTHPNRAGILDHRQQCRRKATRHGFIGLCARHPI